MSKPIVVKVLCEGQTEEKFIKSVIQPYFSNLIISPINLGGGICFNKIKQFIQPYLKDRIHITTFLDYYGFDFSREENLYDFLQKISCPFEKVNLAQTKLQEFIKQELSLTADLFIPHIQPYEFEAVLFSDVNAFDKFEKFIHDLQKIRDSFESPEHINNSKTTAPSKRILNLLGQSYGKNSDGIIIAKKIGILKMQQECKHFASWIEKLKYLESKNKIK